MGGAEDLAVHAAVGAGDGDAVPGCGIASEGRLVAAGELSGPLSRFRHPRGICQAEGGEEPGRG